MVFLSRLDQRALPKLLVIHTEPYLAFNSHAGGFFWVCVRIFPDEKGGYMLHA